MWNNNFASAWSLHLVFNFMAVTNEPLEQGMWSLVWRQIMTIATNSVWNNVYKSKIINMASVRNSKEVMPEEFNIKSMLKVISCFQKDHNHNIIIIIIIIIIIYIYNCKQKNCNSSRVRSYDPLIRSSTLIHERNCCYWWTLNLHCLNNISNTRSICKARGFCSR
jgi:hypothetical protein